MPIGVVFSDVAREIAECLDCDMALITASTTAADIDNWNSLNNVKLLIRLERRFGVRFSGIDATNLQNVGELVELIASKTSK
jgi:acyl carrier protein